MYGSGVSVGSMLIIVGCFFLARATIPESGIETMSVPKDVTKASELDCVVIGSDLVIE